MTENNEHCVTGRQAATGRQAHARRAGRGAGGGEGPRLPGVWEAAVLRCVHLASTGRDDPAASPMLIMRPRGRFQ